MLQLSEFRFLSGKPLIDQNLVPRFEFRFDAFRGRKLADPLWAKIPMFPSIPSAAVGLQVLFNFFV